MKILIISPPRAGSTSLLDSISDLCNYESIFEPYINEMSQRTTDRKPYPFNVPDNSVVKMISYQVPKNYGKPSNFLDFIVSVYRDYDKVILLNRRNEKEHFESYVNLIIKNKNPIKNSTRPWYYEDITDKLHLFDLNEIIPYRNVIDELSNKLSIPITYYEDLYGNDRLKSLEIIKKWKLDIDNGELNERLNPKFRYRQSKNKRRNLI